MNVRHRFVVESKVTPHSYIIPLYLTRHHIRPHIPLLFPFWLVPLLFWLVSFHNFEHYAYHFLIFQLVRLCLRINYWIRSCLLPTLFILMDFVVLVAGRLLAYLAWVSEKYRRVPFFGYLSLMSKKKNKKGKLTQVRQLTVFHGGAEVGERGG